MTRHGVCNACAATPGSYAVSIRRTLVSTPTPVTVDKSLCRKPYIDAMIKLVEEHLSAITALCRKFGVRKLELFGSAAAGTFDAQTGDVDFFYEFDTNLEHLADRYFGLNEELSTLLGKPVDLISSADVHNPYFLQVANRHRVTLYAA